MKLILICFVFLVILPHQSKAQSIGIQEGVEIVPGILFPTVKQQPHYKPAFSFYGNYHFIDAQEYSIYTGVGFYAMHPKEVLNDEIQYGTFWALNLYQGGQLKLNVAQNMNVMLGGEIGGKYVFYAYNVLNGGSGSIIKPFLGLSPKLGFSWRPGGSYFSMNIQAKYNMYFSLQGPYQSNGPEFGFIQSLNLGLGLMANF